MANDYFDWAAALNEVTGSTLPNAIADIYAQDDTGFSVPLAITDVSDVPLAHLIATPTGLYPPFKVVSGETHVVALSGDVVTPITSLLGRLFDVFPNPQGAADGQTLSTEGDTYVLSAGGGTGDGGAGIQTFAVGSDTSSVPEGGVFGTYVPPVVQAVPQRIGSLVASSGGTTAATSIVLNPAAPTEGTAVLAGDWMVALVGANAPGAGEDFTAPAGWTELRPDYSLIGTQRVRVYARKRVAGDTTYTWTFPSAKHLNATMVWVRGAEDLGTWVLGAAKGRSDAPAETLTSTAPAITTSKPATLALTLGIERTTSTEAGVTWAGATQWLFAPQVSSAAITFAVGFVELAAAGTSPAVTITYPNAQTINGWAFQIGIPGV